MTRLIRAAGLRWPAEEDFGLGKDCFGLDESQVRLYTAIARHTVLVMAALAICAVTAALLRCRTDTGRHRLPRPASRLPPTRARFIALTFPEFRVAGRHHRTHLVRRRRRHRWRRAWRSGPLMAATGLQSKANREAQVQALQSKSHHRSKRLDPAHPSSHILHRRRKQNEAHTRKQGEARSNTSHRVGSRNRFDSVARPDRPKGGRLKVEVTVLVPAHNEAQDIGTTIESIQGQSRPPQGEVRLHDRYGCDVSCPCNARCDSRVRLGLRRDQLDRGLEARYRAEASAVGHRSARKVARPRPYRCRPSRACSFSASGGRAGTSRR